MKPNNSKEKFSEVYWDKLNKIITIYNEIHFYGNAANKLLAKQIAKAIEHDWNEAKGVVVFYDKNHSNNLDVKFIIKGFYSPKITKDEILQNELFWKKYFRIEQTSRLHISYVDGVFSNTGWFMLKNVLLPNSKTVSHEMGHCWGLMHPLDLDFRGQGQPHIMFPRGTLVDPEYRYKPNAEAKIINGELVLEEGCTVHTDKRKVTQFNIDKLNLLKLNYDAEGYANLSKLTNIFHEL